MYDQVDVPLVEFGERDVDRQVLVAGQREQIVVKKVQYSLYGFGL